jgi:hypothetical protein
VVVVVVVVVVVGVGGGLTKIRISIIPFIAAPYRITITPIKFRKICLGIAKQI